VERQAAKLLRSEITAIREVKIADAERIGTLLDRRRSLFAKWKTTARARGLILIEPTKLAMDSDAVRGLRSVAPPYELDELARIEEKFEAADRLETWDKVRAALVASVQRHEVQHRIDFAREQPMQMPPALETFVGKPDKQGDPSDRARAELSAYLAEIARDD